MGGIPPSFLYFLKKNKVATPVSYFHSLHPPICNYLTKKTAVNHIIEGVLTCRQGWNGDFLRHMGPNMGLLRHFYRKYHPPGEEYADYSHSVQNRVPAERETRSHSGPPGPPRGSFAPASSRLWCQFGSLGRGQLVELVRLGEGQAERVRQLIHGGTLTPWKCRTY